MTEHPKEHYCPRCNIFAFIEDACYQCGCFRCYRFEPRDPYPPFWLDADKLLEAAPAMLAALRAIIELDEYADAMTESLRPYNKHIELFRALRMAKKAHDRATK